MEFDTNLGLFNKEKTMDLRKLSQCGPAGCPSVFEVIASCGIGMCPTVLKADDDLIIVGRVLTDEEGKAAAPHIKAGEETAVRVPRSLIAGLKL